MSKGSIMKAKNSESTYKRGKFDRDIFTTTRTGDRKIMQTTRITGNFLDNIHLNGRN